jgi:alkylated DNA repair dioxygenase AlkB
VQTLFDDPLRDSRISYAPNFLAPEEARALCSPMIAHAPWEVEAPVVFGKAHPVARRSCAFGDDGVSYRYSGLLRSAHPWPEWLHTVKANIEAATQARYNFVLCNLYPDGKAGLGWHSDDEKDLVAGASIASLSLGEPRDFYVRRRDSREVVLRVSLGPGSLLVMERQSQRHFQHQVPKRARCVLPRVNLTFRLMQRAPALVVSSTPAPPRRRTRQTP